MDNLNEFLERTGLLQKTGRYIEPFRPADAKINNFSYEESELTNANKRDIYDLSNVDRFGIIELSENNCCYTEC